MLTTLLFGLGLVLLWRKPSWGRLAWFAALILAVYVVLVWLSSGYYLAAAEAPLGERWNAVMLRALAWGAGFAALGALVIWFRTRRSSQTQ